MIGLDVGDEKAPHGEVEEGTEGLVGLEHEQIGFAEMGAGLVGDHLAAHDEGRVAPRGPRQQLTANDLGRLGHPERLALDRGLDPVAVCPLEGVGHRDRQQRRAQGRGFRDLWPDHRRVEVIECFLTDPR